MFFLLYIANIINILAGVGPWTKVHRTFRMFCRRWLGASCLVGCVLKVLPNVNIISGYFHLGALQQILVMVARTTVITTAHNFHLNEAFCVLRNFGSFETSTSLNKPRKCFDISIYHSYIQIYACRSWVLW